YDKELQDYDLILIDTAGRDALSQDLIKEIQTLNNILKPDERLLVISADIGQAAQKQAQTFHDVCNISGVIVTKMDGTAKAGGALTACAATKSQIKFIGLGEKADDLEVFNPEGFVSRLLGMGDLEALLEKAKEVISEDQVKDLGKKFIKGEFNFLDLYEQMQAMSKMGPLSKLVELIPGFGKMNIPKEMLEGQQEKIKKWKFMMQSMTKEELEDPEIISGNRIDRIAKGSGVKVEEVRELLKQYRQSKKMLKMMKGQGAEKMMKKMQGKVAGM
ncbi:signal recognition particle protein Srp19, partial [Candidatus Woesearchaeota archaeon]|nr:signal recognition particle protein Srp19 [Candidatus Woesearchaeota archaeon]